eukprot:6795735-Pyramimonas_sp.AAC.1
MWRPELLPPPRICVDDVPGVDRDTRALDLGRQRVLFHAAVQRTQCCLLRYPLLKLRQRLTHHTPLTPACDPTSLIPIGVQHRIGK